MLLSWRDLPFVLPVGLLLASVADHGHASLAALALAVHMAFTVVNGRFGRVRVVTWCLLLLAWTLTEFAGFFLPRGQLAFWIAARLDGAPWGEFLMALLVWAAVLPALIFAIDVAVARRDDMRAHRRTLANKVGSLVMCAIVGVGLAWLTSDLTPHLAPDAGLLTPADIVPPWYLRAHYALLRAVPNKAIGAVLALTALFAPVFWPIARADRVRHSRFAPLFLAACALGAANWFALGVVGGMAYDSAAFWLAPMLASVHFAFFLAGPFVWRRLGRDAADRELQTALTRVFE